MARKIWEWAEVGYQEKRSSALLADALESGGFRVERGVAGIPTAFIATIGSGRPVIAILGEYDALPGLSQQAEPVRRPATGITAGHACGHHLFGTASAAACLALAEPIKAGTLKGTLRFYGCPAEEGGSAKAFMVRAHLFDDCDAVLHWHPSSENATGDVSSQARIAAKFRFHGISSHAAGAPEAGRSALDAVELTNYAAELLREHTPDYTRIHHVITAGGEAPNVVPDFAEVSYYIRHPKAEVVKGLYARLVKCAEAGALATETRLETQYLGGIVEIVPNPVLGRVARMNLERFNDISYDAHEAEFAAADPQDPRRDAPAAVAGDPVSRGRSHGPRRHGLDRRRRRLVGRADGRVHDGLLGPGHLGALVAGGRGRGHDDRPQGDDPGGPHAGRHGLGPVLVAPRPPGRQGRASPTPRRPPLPLAARPRPEAAARLSQRAGAIAVMDP